MTGMVLHYRFEDAVGFCEAQNPSRISSANQSRSRRGWSRPLGSRSCCPPRLLSPSGMYTQYKFMRDTALSNLHYTCHSKLQYYKEPKNGVS